MKKSAVLALVLAFLFIPIAVFAQQETTQPPTGPGQQPPAGTSEQPAAGPHQHGTQQAPGKQRGTADQGMMEMCKQMMAKKQEVMARMKEMDEILKKELAEMNAATGDEKIRAMANVISTMANQRIEMHEMAMNLHESMMGHMGQHMQSMGGQGMSGCPMMQMMMHGKQGTQSGHDAHHGTGSGAAGQ